MSLSGADPAGASADEPGEICAGEIEEKIVKKAYLKIIF